MLSGTSDGYHSAFRTCVRLSSAAILTLLTVAAASGRAQDFPVVTYTTADGLPHDWVSQGAQDERGFLWFGTGTALARFDGEKFTAYGRAEGLDVGTGLNDLRIDKGGVLWLATNGAGIFRFDLSSTDRATRFKHWVIGRNRAANRVNSIAFAPDDRIWAGTDAGVFVGRSDREIFERVELPLAPGRAQDALQVVSVKVHGSDIWFATLDGTFVCRGESTAGCVKGPPEPARALLLARDFRLWIGGDHGIQVWTLDNGALVGQPERLAESWRITSLIDDSRGGVLASTYDGRVLEIANHKSRVLFQSESVAQISSVMEDTAGNVWLATTSGLLVIRRQGVTLFSTQHGLQQPYTRTVFADASGRLYALSDGFWLHQLEGGRFIAVRLILPPEVHASLWRKAIHIDRSGDVWLGTADGLCRYASVTFSPDHTRAYQPAAVYTTRDGLAGNHIASIFEDAHGDIWIGSSASGPDTLTVWRRQSGTFERLGASIGLPPFNQPGDIAEDTRGAIWFPLREGGVARIRNGRADVFGVGHGLPWLFVGPVIDRDGQIWFGGTDSIVRIAHPDADVVQATTVVSGLGARTLAMKRDFGGTIYAATQAGLLAIDPHTGRVRRYSSYEGVPPGDVDALASGAGGTILLVAGRTLVRLAPWRSATAAGTPSCYISGLRVGGLPRPLPEAGVERVEAFDVYPTQNHIELEFVGLSRQIGELLTYQYRLVGVSDSWASADQRRITYAGLAPGRYQFQVRAISADGNSTSSPAQATFTVVTPWYRRWWFLGGCAATLAALAYAAHRTQLAQAVYAERLRSRIATDLHDDVGASLSQIAILAEVVQRREGSSDATNTERLAAIATTSRDLVDAMGDIVWAVNPRTDSLVDLTRRMRRFAGETLGSADITLLFSAPSEDIDLKLGPHLRREIYLILKESVTNIARHSRASKARVELQLARQELRLSVADNGVGFDPSGNFEGNGLASMRKRVAELGGDLVILSAPGLGAHVTLTVKLRRSRFDPTWLRSTLRRFWNDSNWKSAEHREVNLRGSHKPD
jgi:signal transduction histidine kinase/ligand-binding sensor domain-containing protein